MRGPYGKLWTEFFPSFYGQSAKRAGHENKEGKSEDPQLAARTEQKKLIRCLLFGFFDYSGKTRKSFDVLTSDQQLERSIWLLTDLKLTNHSTRNQPYNNELYCIVSYCIVLYKYRIVLLYWNKRIWFSVKNNNSLCNYF